MFNLEQSIAQWRQQMLAAGIQSPVPLEELESHLREEFEQQVKQQPNASKAFEAAVAAIGAASPLVKEFRKIGLQSLNLSVAGLAWGAFVVSFFLPSYSDGYGWECAYLAMQSVFWQETVLGRWTDFHFASLNFANLWMVASPLLFLRFSISASRLLFVRLGSFLALALTWSFIVNLLLHTDRTGNDLRFGCYVWAFSFLLLSLSQFAPYSPKKKYV